MDRNPVFQPLTKETADRQGADRHVLCPHYDKCLNEAIVRNRHFSCRACGYRRRRIEVYLVHDGTLEES